MLLCLLWILNMCILSTAVKYSMQHARWYAYTCLYIHTGMYMTMKKVLVKKAHLLRSLSWKDSEKLMFLFSSTKTVVFSNIQVAAL